MNEEDYLMVFWDTGDTFILTVQIKTFIFMIFLLYIFFHFYISTILKRKKRIIKDMQLIR